MEKLFVLFFLALISSAALGMSLRHKRQSNDNQDNVEDRYGWDNPRQRPWFPGQMVFPGQFPGQQQQSTTTTTTTTTVAPANGVTTMSPAVRECIQRCPVTSEYNPVCGSNNMTYDNPGRLTCAQACGVNVNLQRSSRCPASG